MKKLVTMWPSLELFVPITCLLGWQLPGVLRLASFSETTRKASLTLFFFSLSLDLGTSLGGATELWPQSKPAAAATADIWGDFTKSTG